LGFTPFDFEPFDFEPFDFEPSDLDPDPDREVGFGPRLPATNIVIRQPSHIRQFDATLACPGATALLNVRLRRPLDRRRA